MSLLNNKLPYNLNLDHEIDSKMINFIKQQPMDLELNNVLSNSFGFGGTNVSLIFSRFNGKSKN